MHVVLGAGGVGASVAVELARRGEPATVVSRSGRDIGVDGVQTRAADLSDPDTAREVCRGATVVYHCVSPAYHRWKKEFPGVHSAIINAASASGSRLVFADNLYAYGMPGDAPMSEDTPPAPRTEKDALRETMATALLNTHAQGQVDAVVARASDYFGPRANTSQLGPQVFSRLLAGKKAQVLGNPDTLHSYTYLPDFARALVNLGGRPDAAGQVWHVPNTPATTTRQMVGRVAESIGAEPRLSVAPPALLAVASWFVPTIRAVREQLYQMQHDWVVDDRKYRAAFAEGETPVEEAIAATVAWYRGRSS